MSASANRSPQPRGLLTLPEQIAERIYSDIVEGHYHPGDRIREEAIAVALGVSRGPVREALRILERDAVVRLLPNRGAHVTKLSVREVNDVFEIRAVLAGAMARRLATRGRDVVARLEDGVQELERLATRVEDGGQYVAASVRLAQRMAQATGNDRLADIMRSLARQSWRYTLLTLADAKRRRASARRWRTVFGALLAGDADRAGQLMESLVDESRREAMRVLGAATQPQAPARIQPEA
ncbi:MAG: GntR family transcriptional regulator [Burkholderiaceae bacterium]|nr:GntR family transcriptional regulator [Burkholderiaceae bacterium]